MKYLKEIKKLAIPISQLHFQYLEPVFNKKFWPENDMLVANSPHVHFLKLYQKHGDNFKELWKSRYVQQFLYWRRIGFHHRDDKYIKSKIRRVVNLYNSIKRHGYIKKHRISALSESIWASRYGGKNVFLGDYEIWHGHHRSAVCYVLGIKEVPCILFQNILFNTKKGDKLLKRINSINERKRN